MLILDILGPIVLVVALGFFLRSARVVPPTVFRHTNRLTYRVAMPAMLFVKTATMDVDFQVASGVVFALATATITLVFFAGILGHFFGLRHGSFAAFVQGAFRGNLVFVGLAVLFNLADSDPKLAPLENLAVLALGPIVPLNNLIAVGILESNEKRGKGRAKQGRLIAVLRGILQNPLFLSCVLGLLLASTGVSLPVLFGRTGLTLGRMALPLALLGIGASLKLATSPRPAQVVSESPERRGMVKALPVACATVVKLGLAPALGFAGVFLLHLDRLQALTVLVFLATPTGVTSYIMAEQMGADAQLAGRLVVVTTLLCILPLSWILALI